MNELVRVLNGPERPIFFTATADGVNSVNVSGNDTSVTLPAINPVVTGEDALVARVGQGAQFIVGPVGGSAVKVGQWTASQSMTSGGGVTAITLDSEVADPDGWWSSGTDVTPTVAGWYLVTAAFEWSSIGTATTRLILSARKNGTGFALFDGYAGSGSAKRTVTGVVSLNGSTDYIDHGAYHNDGSNRTVTTTLTVALIAAT